MSYELAFHPEALKEWGKLDASVRAQFKKKLAERLLNPRVPAAQLAGRSDRDKIEPLSPRTRNRVRPLSSL
ncbi:type II toxin-antitoxin system RelE family toxin [Thiocystis violacea]|uniref:type II toxin-antitoxin system RelE family toxin n=1 Tax=Thiocystis violacea TaxID=13725 RepID=UPI0019061CA0|nr:type II toxin-antitoxin system RelE/ParE family toxin [Thiocystis violacea]